MVWPQVSSQGYLVFCSHYHFTEESFSWCWGSWGFYSPCSSDFVSRVSGNFETKDKKIAKWIGEVWALGVKAPGAQNTNFLEKMRNLEELPHPQSSKFMPQKIDGKKIAERIKNELKNKISKISKKHRIGLAAILVGDNHASKIYLQLKEKAAKEVGIHFQKYIFTENTSQEEILHLVQNLNKNSKIHGIIVQLPLPKKFSTQKIIHAIDPKKDADGFLPKNNYVKPVLVEVVLEIFHEAKENLDQKTILVIGNSKEFLQSMKKYLKPLVKKIQTINYQSWIPQYWSQKKIDDVIIAVGVPHFFQPYYIKDNAGIIDIGITEKNKKILGDVNPMCYKTARFYTPVPGGVGPITVAKLLENVYKLFIASTEK